MGDKTTTSSMTFDGSITFDASKGAEPIRERFDSMEQPETIINARSLHVTAGRLRIESDNGQTGRLYLDEKELENISYVRLEWTQVEPWFKCLLGIHLLPDGVGTKEPNGQA